MDHATFLEQYREAASAGMEAITLYLTVLTAYLVVAYLVGAKLSSFQTFLATSLMLVFAGFFTAGTLVFFSTSHGIALRYGPEFGVSVGEFPVFPYVITFAEILGIIGALIFIYQERKKKE